MAAYDDYKSDNGERPDYGPTGGYVYEEDWENIQSDSMEAIAKALDRYEPCVDVEGGQVRVQFELRIDELQPAAVDRETWAAPAYLPPDFRDLREDVITALEGVIDRIREDILQRPSSQST